MSMYVEETFGGAKRKFRLGIGELRELQDATGVGPATLVSRMLSPSDATRSHQRPDPSTYPKGDVDLDYQADFNAYALLRNLGGDWRVDDLRETIRLGLRGGGMTPTDADVAMMRFFDRNDRHVLSGFVSLAAKILIHAIAPNPDDPVGKAEAETMTATVAPTDA